MSVLVCTPCYGGQLTVGYLRSVFSILDQSCEVNFLVTEGESLVSRARNNLVRTFLGSGYDTLAFIDADIEIDGADFARLAGMDGVRGAGVCLKTPDHVESLSVWRDGKQIKRAEMPSEPFRVDFLGAAVLLIPREVFERLIESEAVTAYEDAGMGAGHDFFPCGAVEGTYLSEDYGFCDLLRSIDEPIWCDPSTVVRHYGAAFWSA